MAENGNWPAAREPGFFPDRLDDRQLRSVSLLFVPVFCIAPSVCTAADACGVPSNCRLLAVAVKSPVSMACLPRLAEQFCRGRAVSLDRAYWSPMPRYNPAVIEPKWQAYWAEHKTFAAPRLPVGQKLYVLDMFPYPSGDGLHVGHPEGYTATDIICRFERMRGRSVMHPMGWDAFGLPAEQHAKKTGTPPRVTTEKNIATFKRQLQTLGFSYDWGRELSTTDPDYFRWTQWIFLQLFDTWFDLEVQRGRPIAELPIPPEVVAAGIEAERRYQDRHRLAYQSEAPVNWCPALGTVLANEEVVGGVSERGGHPVVRIPLRQWMLRITAYADRLEKDLDGLDWSDSIKALQRNWIGRSTGAELDFFIGTPGAEPAANRHRLSSKRGATNARPTSFPPWPEDVVRVFTTRPDTLFGATYLVLAPEHPLVPRLTTPEQAEAVRAYAEQAARKSDLDRTDLAKQKTGVFTGSFAANPVNSRPVPIWVADYVLAGYGTGAIMAVPAHDTRDFEFAVQFDLPIVAVVDPGTTKGVVRDDVLAGKAVFTGEGTAINAGATYDGLKTAEFKQRITADLAAKGQGREAVNYKLRDWLFSRQHFWGEPFPVLHELDADGRLTGLMRADLVRRVAGRPARAKAVRVARQPRAAAGASSGRMALPRHRRQTLQARNEHDAPMGRLVLVLSAVSRPEERQALVDPEVERQWMPVNVYIGGAEHAVLHLLYARFWHKVLYDRGLVSTSEPFHKLVNQGMILGEMELTGYQTSGQEWVSGLLIDSSGEDGAVLRSSGESVKPVRVAPDAAEKAADGFVLKSDRTVQLESRAYKMSKSRGNVVNPDAVVREYGADALRLFEMFMGPLEATKPWSMEGVSGVRGFLDRVWRMIVHERAEPLELNPAVRDVEITPEQNRMLHKTIGGVTQDHRANEL